MKFEEILSILEDYNNFEYFNVDNLPELEDLFKDYIEISIHCGMTKLVIDDSSLPFVIKLPFMGFWEYTGYDEEPMTHRESPQEYEWYSFNGANNNDISLCYWDYCEAEAAMYQEIEKNENDYILNFFAETKRVSTFTTFPLYIQEKCKPSHKLFSIQETRITQNIYKHYNLESNCNIQWLTDVREQYGEDILIELLMVLRTYNIRDLHGDNVGYNYNTGKLIIFDYSSYFD